MARNQISQLLKWYARSELDYERAYIALYITYNTWYSYILQTTNDRKAITDLKKRYVIWDEVMKGSILPRFKAHMYHLSELTQREPLRGTSIHWNGEVSSEQDWPSLIEYWYHIRCRLMHGGYVERMHLILAYETLSLFMSEIVTRIQRYQAIGEPTWQVDMIRRRNT